jgi:hypothetical protein
MKHSVQFRLFGTTKRTVKYQAPASHALAQPGIAAPTVS